MGKYIRKFEKEVAEIQARDKDLDVALMYAGQSGAFQALAQIMAEKADLEADLFKMATEAPEPRTGMVQATIYLEGEKLTVHGNYTPAESAEPFYPGRDAEFEVDEVFKGGQSIGMFLDTYMDEIAELALKAYEEGESEAAAAAKFDRRAA